MAKKDEEVIEEPTLEDLEEEEAEEKQNWYWRRKEEVETESLEARVEKEKKSVEEGDETEGSFISVDAAEKRNVKKSDLELDEVVEEIQEDEFTCSICFWY